MIGQQIWTGSAIHALESALAPAGYGGDLTGSELRNAQSIDMLQSYENPHGWHRNTSFRSAHRIVVAIHQLRWTSTWRNLAPKFVP
jgi:hypothetical protein